jgi:ferritin-like protein
VSRHVSVEVHDHDATLRAALNGGGRRSRATLLKKAAAAGGTLAVGGVLVGTLPSFAAAKPSRKQDRQIFEFLLGLEELQAAFYAEARSKRALVGELRQFAEVVGAHERDHVAFLAKQLGRPSRVAARSGDFGNAATDQTASSRRRPRWKTPSWQRTTVRGRISRAPGSPPRR